MMSHIIHFPKLLNTISKMYCVFFNNLRIISFMFTLKYVGANYETHKSGAPKKLDASILKFKIYTHTTLYA